MISNILFYLDIILLVAGVAYISYGLITEKAAQRGSFYESNIALILLVMGIAVNLTFPSMQCYPLAIAGLIFGMACIIYNIILKMKQGNMQNMKRDLFWLAFTVVTILIVLFFAWW